MNGWQKPVVVDMQRHTPEKTPEDAAEPPAAAGDWWSADMSIPYEAAAMNFVVNFQNHYDNNGSQDYKLNVRMISMCSE